MKRFPKLEKLLLKSGPRARQTEAQMLSVARLLAGVSFPAPNSKG